MSLGGHVWMAGSLLKKLAVQRILSSVAVKTSLTELIVMLPDDVMTGLALSCEAVQPSMVASVWISHDLTTYSVLVGVHWRGLNDYLMLYCYNLIVKEEVKVEMTVEKMHGSKLKSLVFALQDPSKDKTQD